MPNQTYPATVRMRVHREILEVFKKGIYLPLGPIGVRYLPTNQQTSRFLVAVKKRVGHAPLRNLIKRLLRESLRHQRERLRDSHDICLFVTQTPKHPLKYKYVSRLIAKLVDELNRQSTPAVAESVPTCSS